MNLIILAFWSGGLMVGGFRGLWLRGGGCNTLMMMGMDCMSQGQRICRIREVGVMVVLLQFDMVLCNLSNGILTGLRYTPTTTNKLVWLIRSESFITE